MTEIKGVNNLNQYFGAVIVLVNGIFVLYFALNLIFHVYFFMPRRCAFAAEPLLSMHLQEVQTMPGYARQCP